MSVFTGERHSSQVVLFIATIFHVVFSLWVAKRFLISPGGVPAINEIEYTYLASDYPLEYPVGDLEPVAMSLHESVHYSLNATDPVADLEWMTLAANPRGVGRTRLGPDHRLFVMTFHHQIHCLRQFQLALTDTSGSITHPHLHHCFNYLRQTFLCVGADMLEKGDFMQRDYEKDRIGDDLVCQDWMRVYDVLDQNYADWLQWKNT